MTWVVYRGFSCNILHRNTATEHARRKAEKKKGEKVLFSLPGSSIAPPRAPCQVLILKAFPLMCSSLLLRRAVDPKVLQSHAAAAETNSFSPHYYTLQFGPPWWVVQTDDGRHCPATGALHPFDGHITAHYILTSGEMRKRIRERNNKKNKSKRVCYREIE